MLCICFGVLECGMGFRDNCQPRDGNPPVFYDEKGCNNSEEMEPGRSVAEVCYIGHMFWSF